MSLRSFHVFFITVALGLLLFMAWWSGTRVMSGHNGQSLAMVICAGAGLLAGLPYLAWFLRKTKQV